MKPKFRIRKTSKGYVVEYAVKRWFRVQWVPLLTYLGSVKAFPFSTFKGALDQALAKIQGQIMDDCFKPVNWK